MKDRALDSRRTATLGAKASEIKTGFKSFLLKALDPLFKKKGSQAGAVIPLKISGSTDKPAFGPDMLGGKNKRVKGGNRSRNSRDLTIR